MTTLEETGAHDWQNYVDYWRDSDAEWLQSRSVLRVNAPADLATLPPPGAGQMVYVKDVAAGQKDVLFMYASVGSTGSAPGWVPYPALPRFLYASEDTAARVTFGHHPGNPAAVVPAVTMSPTGLDVISDMRVRTDKFKVTATDVQIKTGTKNVVLTTDAAGLVSDSPIKAPGLTSTGGITVTGAVSAGTVTAASVTATGAVSGATLGATGAITAGTTVTAGGGDTGGFRAGTTASFLSDPLGAVLKAQPWVAGDASLLVAKTGIKTLGGTTQIDNQLSVMSNRSINFYNAANSAIIGYGGPVIYSSADPGGPNGTIWVIP